jgi:hypothetical protein
MGKLQSPQTLAYCPFVLAIPKLFANVANLERMLPS